MKKQLLLIISLFVATLAFSQEIPPNGLKALTTATRYYNPADSSIWTYKGPLWGWHREGKYSDVNGRYFNLNNNNLITGFNTYAQMQDFNGGISGYFQNPGPNELNNFNINKSGFGVYGNEFSFSATKDRLLFLINGNNYFSFDTNQGLVINRPTGRFMWNPNGVQATANNTSFIATSDLMEYKGFSNNANGNLILIPGGRFSIILNSTDSIGLNLKKDDYLSDLHNNKYAKQKDLSILTNQKIDSLKGAANNWTNSNSFYEVLSNNITVNNNLGVGGSFRASIIDFHNIQLIPPLDQGDPAHGYKLLAYTTSTNAPIYLPQNAYLRLGEANIQTNQKIDSLKGANNNFTGQNSFMDNVSFNATASINNQLNFTRNAIAAFRYGTGYDQGDIKVFLDGGDFVLYKVGFHKPEGIYEADATFKFNSNGAYFNNNKLLTNLNYIQKIDSLKNLDNIWQGANEFSRLKVNYAPTSSTDVIRLQDIVNRPDSTTIANNYLKKSGGIISGDILLSSISPANQLSAVSKGYVDNSLRFKLNSTVGYFGDSHTSYGVDTGNPYFNTWGETTWFNLYTGGRFYQPSGFNKGVAGNTTTQMIARLGTALTDRPELILIEGGGNDIIAGASASTIQTNLDNIVNAYRAAGAKVIIRTILPRFAANAYTAPQEAIRQSVNNYLLTLSNANVQVVDVASVVNSSAVFQADGIHVTSQGANIIGALLAEKANALIDQQNITDNLTQDAAFTTNLALTGNNGGLNTATGQIANNWTLAGNNAGGATITGSKTTANNVNQQVISVSGNVTGTKRYAGLFNNFATTSITQGDVTESFLDFEVTNTLQNVAAIGISETYDGASGYLADSYSMFPIDGLSQSLPLGRYQLRGFPFVAPTGVTNVGTNVTIFFADGTSLPVSGSIKIWKAGVRKVLPMNATTSFTDSKYVTLSGSTSTGKQIIQTTSEQLRLASNATNFSSFTTNSDGTLSINPTGGATTLSGSLAVGAVSSTGIGTFTGLVTGSINTNIYIPSNTSAAATSGASMQFAGSSINVMRTAVASGNSLPTVGDTRNYSGFMVSSSSFATSANATIPWAANAVVNPLGTISTGSGSQISNTSTLYIGGASSTGVNNYALYSASGLVNLVNQNENLRLSYDASNYSSLATNSGGSLLLSATGGISFNPTNGIVSFGTATANVNNVRNTSSSNNSLIGLATTGTSISRNVNDSNLALTVNKQQGTGNIQSWQFGATNKSTINIDGEYEVQTISKGVILRSPDGTRYRITVANGGALQTTAL